MRIGIKNVYARKEPDDGKWILVAREWPKGVPKGKIDEWYKDLAPSHGLYSDWKQGKIQAIFWREMYLEEIESQSKSSIDELVKRGIEEDFIIVSAEKGDGRTRTCYRSILRIHIRIQVSDRMENKFKEMISSNPQNADAHLQFGTFIESCGGYSRALDYFDEALELRPDRGEAWFHRGNIMMHMRKWPYSDRSDMLGKAVANYDRAIQLRPDIPEAWHYRAIALEELGMSEKAIASYDKAIEIKSDCAEIWHNRGMAFASSKKYERSARDFEKVIELEQDNIDSKYYRDAAYCLDKIRAKTHS